MWGGSTRYFSSTTPWLSRGPYVISGFAGQQLEFSVKYFFILTPTQKRHTRVNIWRQTRCQIKKKFYTNFFLNIIFYNVLKFRADRKTLSKVMGEEAKIFGRGIHVKVAILRVNEKIVVGQAGPNKKKHFSTYI